MVFGIVLNVPVPAKAGVVGDGEGIVPAPGNVDVVIEAKLDTLYLSNKPPISVSKNSPIAKPPIVFN